MDLACPIYTALDSNNKKEFDTMNESAQCLADRIKTRYSHSSVQFISESCAEGL